jgi:phosphoserine phosphatase
MAKNTPYADWYAALLTSTTEDCELPKAAIFDLDGTLLDSVDLHAIAWQEDNTADRMAAVSGRCGEASPWRET